MLARSREDDARPAFPVAPQVVKYSKVEYKQGRFVMRGDEPFEEGPEGSGKSQQD